MNIVPTSLGDAWAHCCRYSIDVNVIPSNSSEYLIVGSDPVKGVNGQFFVVIGMKISKRS